MLRDILRNRLLDVSKSVQPVVHEQSVDIRQIAELWLDLCDESEQGALLGVVALLQLGKVYHVLKIVVVKTELLEIFRNFR